MNPLLPIFPFMEVIIILLVGIFTICLSLYFFKKKPRKGFIILCVFSLFLLYLQYCDELDKVFSPPYNIHNFEDLAGRAEFPLNLYRIEFNQEEFIEAVVSPGKFPSLLRLTSFRSGMPAYVFDLKGGLVDSTIDHHDDARYQDKWGKPRENPKQRITESSFLQMISKAE